MIFPNIPLRILSLVLIFFVGCAIANSQIYEGHELVEADLIADVESVQPGIPFYVALRLKQVPAWHTYWQFSGDAGLPTSIQWDLPPGFEAGPILWPLPHYLVEPGDLHVYAYMGETLLLTEIRPSSDISIGSTFSIRAKASWLVCEEICVPGSKELSLSLKASAQSTSSLNAPLIAAWLGKLPSPDALPYPFSWSRAAQTLILELKDIPANVKVEFFPLPPENIIPGHPEVIVSGETRTIRIPFQNESEDQIEVLPGILKLTGPNGDTAGWELNETFSMPQTGNSNPASGGLWKFLLYGFLGGLILNLMPCVLPVISLKVFGFIRQAGESPARIFKMGLTFVGGIFVWFLGMAAVIVIMKSLGKEVTWAFQFQNPWFIVVMSTVVFVFALNLFGVFEIVLPGNAGTKMTHAGDTEGFAGVFFQGIFATILATPCTAPFLGTALAFAFAQSAGLIFLMFGSIALGMGSPYLLLTARPGWMKFLPKPGAWMARLKEFMGFLLIATLLWLLWILGHQGGVGAIIWTGAFLLVTSVACWMIGAFVQRSSDHLIRATAGVAVFILIISAAQIFLRGFLADSLASNTPSTSTVETGGIAWEPFSQSRLESEVGGDRIVFIDFTAQWCLSCKFNERTALETTAVRDWISQNNVLPLKADWTNSDPEITKALSKFGRVGVPFYVIYPAGKNAQPVTLPELLTENIVLEGFREAASRSAAARE